MRSHLRMVYRTLAQRKHKNLQRVFGQERPRALCYGATMCEVMETFTGQTLISLGPFLLSKLVGRGAMGEVWAGVHVHQQVPVAVKVLTRSIAHQARHLSFFRREVQAIARLHHTGIVSVYDFGRVPEESQQHSKGALSQGSLYLAMELVEGGTFKEPPYPWNWSVLRTVLLSLLDALSHAHAREVIHRDIKPGNVLFAHDAQGNLRVKLTDFGIAHTVRQVAHHEFDNDGRVRLAGTPRYMAPEQFQGHWRDYGPWTDLYALGCVAYRLVYGRPPFVGDQREVMMGHLALEPPSRKPCIDVPDGFEAWVRALLEKRPEERFSCAADASWALLSLEKELRSSSRSVWMALPSANLLRSGATIALSKPPVASPQEPLTTVILTKPSSATPPAAPNKTPAIRIHRDPAPMPAHWKPEGRPRELSMSLLGAGLGLYGLRALSLIGRNKERDYLWNTLAQVRSTGEGRVVALHGQAGVGKSRLAQWMCRRAHETGAATVLQAVYNANENDRSLPLMIGQHWGCLNIDRQNLQKRLEHLLRTQGVTDAYEWRALAELLSPTPPGNEPFLHSREPPIRFASPNERYALVRRFVERLSHKRPVLLWLDDVQWSMDAIAFLRHLNRALEHHPQQLRALVLVTYRDEGSTRHTSHGAQLQPALARKPCRVLPLKPLPPQAQAELIKELLGLEPRLAAQVQKRTEGNPLFAIQLVGDWVQRGVLEVSPQGFTLAPGEKGELPDDIHEVWLNHLQLLLEHAPKGTRETLELAAVLGQEIDFKEWKHACKLENLPPRAHLWNELYEARLARPIRNARWRLIHGMLRESLLRMARQNGREAHLHTLCARMLTGFYPPKTRGIQERIGRHFFVANRYQDALAPLYEAAKEMLAQGKLDRVERLLDRRDQAMKAMGCAENDPRYGKAWLMRLELAGFRGERAAARIWLKKSAESATLHRDEFLEASVLVYDARVRRIWSGERHKAREILERAYVLAQRSGNHKARITAQRELGTNALDGGEVDRAIHFYQQSVQLSKQQDDLPELCASLRNLANVLAQQERYEEALAIYQQIFDHSEAWGDLKLKIYVLTGLGEMQRWQGHYAEAESSYRQVLTLMNKMGIYEPIFELNLGLVWIERGRYQEAHDLLETMAQQARAANHPHEFHIISTGLIATTAALGHWESFDHHLNYALEFSAQLQITHPDEARYIQKAAERAAAHRQNARARRAYQAARELWRRQGQHRRIAHIDRVLAALPP